MQENKHRHDYDIARLVPPVKKIEERKNSLLDNLEVKEIPSKGCWNAGKIVQRQLDFQEALQFMDPQKHSILIEKKDRYHIEKAAKRLGYRLTYRQEDMRGIRLYRYWVVSHTIEKNEGGNE